MKKWYRKNRLWVIEAVQWLAIVISVIALLVKK